MAAPSSFLIHKIGPLPAYAWGLAVLGGGGLLILARRHSAAASDKPSPASTKASGDAGAPFGGGSSAGSGSLTGPGGGAAGGTLFNGGLFPQKQFTPGGQQASTPSQAQTKFNSNAQFSTQENQAFGTGIQLSSLQNNPSVVPVGTIQSTSNISNPVGFAAYEQSINPTSYVPSALDLASEQPGGLNVIRAVVDPKNKGTAATYSVYTNSLAGSGAPVPAAKRVTGERYDALGRVIW